MRTHSGNAWQWNLADTCFPAFCVGVPWKQKCYYGVTGARKALPTDTMFSWEGVPRKKKPTYSRNSISPCQSSLGKRFLLIVILMYFLDINLWPYQVPISLASDISKKKICWFEHVSQTLQSYSFSQYVRVRGELKIMSSGQFYMV